MIWDEDIPYHIHTALFYFLSKDGNITPEKARKLRQNSVCLGSSLSMRSFAIEEPGSPVPALYATLETGICQFLIETKFSNFLNKYYQLSTYHSIAIAILEVFFTTIGDFLATVESLSAIFLDYQLGRFPQKWTVRHCVTLKNQVSNALR